MPRRAERLIPRDELGRPLPPGTPDRLPARAELQHAPRSEAQLIALAVSLFQRGLFFEAHEVLEGLWRSAGPQATDATFWKALAQLAAGLCHIQRGNAAGAAALLERSTGHLARFPPAHHGFDTRGLIAAGLQLAQHLRKEGPTARVVFPLLRT